MGINDEEGNQRIYFGRVGRELKVIDAGRYAREFHVWDFGVLLEEKKKVDFVGERNLSWKESLGIFCTLRTTVSGGLSAAKPP